MALLEVENLHVSFQTYGGEVHAVRGVSFSRSSIRSGPISAIP
jgi:ABC-type dipeptide/oligopeptide/nickel transport system ATPase component